MSWTHRNIQNSHKIYSNCLKKIPFLDQHTVFREAASIDINPRYFSSFFSPFSLIQAELKKIIFRNYALLLYIIPVFVSYFYQIRNYLLDGLFSLFYCFSCFNRRNSQSPAIPTVIPPLTCQPTIKAKGFLGSTNLLSYNSFIPRH
jgi:hypothetical protein